MKKECQTIFGSFETHRSEIRKIEKIFEKMNIHWDSARRSSLPIIESNKYKLFRDIRLLEHLRRKKNSWICHELECNLLKLFKQYPSEHSTIRKAFNISCSTYHRLMKGYRGDGWEKLSVKRAERSKKRLNTTERVLVKQMIQPPPKPLTLNEI